MNFIKRLFGRKISIGERALKEVADMFCESQRQRDLLRANGWQMVKEIPFVNDNERLWYHPDWRYKTQSEALKWVDANGFV